MVVREKKVLSKKFEIKLNHKHFHRELHLLIFLGKKEGGNLGVYNFPMRDPSLSKN